MRDLSRTAILDMIGVGRGTKNGVWIPMDFVEWLGSYTAAAMMNQILYWRDIKRQEGNPEGEFYKTYEQWREELYLSEREVRNGLEAVRRVGVKTKAKRAPNGDRVLYYRIDADAFTAALDEFCTSRSVRNVRAETDGTSGPGMYESYERSNTETTTKTTNRESSAPAQRTSTPQDDALFNGPKITTVTSTTVTSPVTSGRKLTPGVNAPRRAKQIPLPANYPLTEEMRAWAAMEYPALGNRIDTEHKKFCNHARSTGKLLAEWRPAWETWMINAVGDFAPKVQGGTTHGHYESKGERAARNLRLLAEECAPEAEDDQGADHQEPSRLLA